MYPRPCRTHHGRGLDKWQALHQKLEATWLWLRWHSSSQDNRELGANSSIQHLQWLPKQPHYASSTSLVNRLWFCGLSQVGWGLSKSPSHIAWCVLVLSLWLRAVACGYSCRTSLACLEILIRAAVDHGMEMALPLGVPTHIHNIMKKWTRLDQVFVMEHTLDRIIVCKAQLNNRGLNMNHLPIVTTINASLARTTTVTIGVQACLDQLLTSCDYSIRCVASY